MSVAAYIAMIAAFAAGYASAALRYRASRRRWIEMGEKYRKAFYRQRGESADYSRLWPKGKEPL